MFRPDLIDHPQGVFLDICSVCINFLLELSHVIKIDVVKNCGYKLQLVQYIMQFKILKLCVASKLLYLCLHSHVASFEIRCSV
jgi:hypothetical protein